MKFLITGTAGFIGYHLAKKLLERGDEVVGLDNINDYYDIDLKFSRLEDKGIDRDKIEWHKKVNSSTIPLYSFVRMNLEDREEMMELFKSEGFDVVVNLAAQAGVRYSLTNPEVYVESNIMGFLNILEACRHYPVKHLVYASSSSVYGSNTQMPFSIHHNVDHPVSLYAASKKSNELMAHTYSHLFNIPTTGLRFFTVYGPWGRPDMALFLFTEAILKDEPIQVFNEGKMKRDFTYVDDIVEGVMRVADKPASKNENYSSDAPDPGTSYAPYRLYNIGNSNPVLLMDFIKAIETTLGKEAIKNMLPLQQGDVPASHADVMDLVKDVDYKPSTPIQQGIDSFLAWYRTYYNK